MQSNVPPSLPPFPQLQLNRSTLFPGLSMTNSASVSPTAAAATLATLTSLAKATGQIKFAAITRNITSDLQLQSQPRAINLALHHQSPMSESKDKPSRSKKPKKASSHHHHQSCQCCSVTEKPYACEWEGCSKRFRQRPHLEAHRAAIHTGRRFICDFPQCGKSFVRRYNQVEHSKIHSPCATNMCSSCGKVFSSRYSLMRHSRAQHNIQLTA